MVNIVTGDGGWDESTTTGFESRLSLNRCELISVTSSPKHLISLTQAAAAAAVVLGEAENFRSSQRLLKQLLLNC